MLRDITLGQFFPGNSIVHKLDPRMKIILTVLYIAVVFTANSVLGFALITAVSLAMIMISKISIVAVLKSMKPLLFIMIFTAVINVFFTAGEEVLFSFWKITVYKEGVLFAAKMVWRLFFLISGDDRRSHPRLCHDDVARPALYTHPYRGDRQDHVCPEGTRCKF